MSSSLVVFFIVNVQLKPTLILHFVILKGTFYWLRSKNKNWFWVSLPGGFSDSLTSMCTYRHGMLGDVGIAVHVPPSSWPLGGIGWCSLLKKDLWKDSIWGGRWYEYIIFIPWQIPSFSKDQFHWHNRCGCYSTGWASTPWAVVHVVYFTASQSGRTLLILRYQQLANKLSALTLEVPTIGNAHHQIIYSLSASWEIVYTQMSLLNKFIIIIICIIIYWH